MLKRFAKKVKYYGSSQQFFLFWKSYFSEYLCEHVTGLFFNELRNIFNFSVLISNTVNTMNAMHINKSPLRASIIKSIKGSSEEKVGDLLN